MGRKLFTASGPETGLSRILRRLLQELSLFYSRDVAGVCLLYDLLHCPWLQALLKVYNCLQEFKERKLVPTTLHAHHLSQEVMELLCKSPISPEIQELRQILQAPHYKALLRAHDIVAQKDFEPLLPPLPDNVPESEDAMRIVCLVKNQQPLGATIKRHEITGDILVARVIHGGLVERSGLLYAGDKLVEVNGVSIEGLDPEQVIHILAMSRGTIMFKVIPASDPPVNTQKMVHVRAMTDYWPQEDTSIPCMDAGLPFQKGDILQIVDQNDPLWWQARKTSDLATCAGLIPSSHLLKRKQRGFWWSQPYQPPACLTSPISISMEEEDDMKIEEKCVEAGLGACLLTRAGSRAEVVGRWDPALHPAAQPSLRGSSPGSPPRAPCTPLRSPPCGAAARAVPGSGVGCLRGRDCFLHGLPLHRVTAWSRFRGVNLSRHPECTPLLSVPSPFSPALRSTLLRPLRPQLLSTASFAIFPSNFRQARLFHLRLCRRKGHLRQLPGPAGWGCPAAGAPYEEVAKYQRGPSDKHRLIVLVGPSGVGVNELRRQLIEFNPSRFQSAVPHTTRSPKSYEVNGREYHYVSKETFESLIYGHRMLEYGEYKGHLYGTSVDAAHTVLSEGKICVVDLEPQSIQLARTHELKPYIIFIKPSNMSYMKQSRKNAKIITDYFVDVKFKDEDLQEMQELAHKMETQFGQFFDHVIVNDNLQDACAQLLSAIQKAQEEPQWVPATWISLDTES
ncbi:MAGUK p55 subfamily member 4 [Ctenodactylus gundi]